MFQNQAFVLMSQLPPIQSQWMELLVPQNEFLGFDIGKNVFVKGLAYSTYEYWMASLNLSTSGTNKTCLEI